MRTARRRLLAACVALTLALALVGCGSSGGSDTPRDLSDKASSSDYDGTAMDPPLPRPNFTLTDTDKQQYSFGSETAAKPTLVYFGYTNCPDVCPFTMANIGKALGELPESTRKDVVVVFVTTDPAHDNPAVVASWLRHFDADLPNKFVGLTGTQEQIDAAQIAAHVTLAEDDGRTHSGRITFYASDDYAHLSWGQATNLDDQIAHDLKVVLA